MKTANHAGASPPLVGSSPALAGVTALARKAAVTRLTVHVTGPPGCGKGVLVSCMHEWSGRVGPLIIANCAAIPSTLAESTFFGSSRGAYTGATEERAGLFRLAHGGTLFLDEVGELPLDVQGKLLRACDERRFLPVGGRCEVEADVRIVTATNRDLAGEVRAGRFREDLYYRLTVITLDVPPLRDRVADIPLLAGHFLARAAGECGRTIEDFSTEAMTALVGYEWPGNVRELSNVVLRAVALTEGSKIELADLPGEVVKTPSRNFGEPGAASVTLPIDLDAAVRAFERSVIRQALVRSGGVRATAAALIGWKRPRLVGRIVEDPTLDPTGELTVESVPGSS